jgi:NAD+ kinase
LANIVDSDFDYQLKENILQDAIENGVICSLRMRFECTVMKAKSRRKKGQFDLADEILGAENDGVFKHHVETESYCILNDVVVVCIYPLSTPRISANFFFRTVVQTPQ